jgi:chromosome segregation protein
MQLKSVKLVGFKSFVDPTTIHIKDGMNGVVGPNGCGKSNIIDAVRWVIGERSAKQLRGQSMADVIFNGTSGRKPVGRASVELLFDNSDGTIVGEYANFSEIAVKREVFREGQSTYSLNGTTCRRQDIVDIFYGTGLGSRSYAIIEQGMISRLIEAKPEDLRNHIEEAAGIAKYKQRRRDTENRMNRTTENLSRLIDLRDELEKQLRHLKRQANAAERYKVFREEERQVNAEIKALHWQSLQSNLEKHQEKIQRHENERERIHALQRAAETDLEKTRLDQVEATDRYNQAQKEFYSSGSEVSRIEQQVQYTQEQLSRWQNELENTNCRWEELSETTTDIEAQISEITHDIESLRPHANTLSETYRNADEALTVAERDMQAWTSQWDQYQSSSAESNKVLEVNRTKFLHYQQEQQNMANRIVRLKDSRNVEQLEELQLGIQPLQDQLQAFNDEREERNTELETLLSHIQDKKRHIEALQKIIDEKKAVLQTKDGRKASLEALQEAAFATHDKSISAWLEEHGLTNYPRLGKDLQVEQGWEVAVETVLKQLFDAVCIDDLSTFVNNFSPLESGELVLVESAQQAATSHLQFTSLADMVKSEWPVAEWLGNVYIAENLEAAKQMRHQLSAYQSIITRDGVWLGRHWLRVAKPVDNQNSVLLRDQEVKQLLEEILELKNQLLGLEEDLGYARHDLSVLEERREQYHQQVQQINNRITQAQSELTEKQTRYDELLSRENSIKQELNECYQRESQLADQITTTEAAIEQHEANVQQFEQQRQQLSSRKESCENNLSSKRHAAQVAKQRADEYDIRLSSNESQLSVLQKTLQRDARQLEGLTERRDELTDSLHESDNPLTELQEELQILLSKRSAQEQELTTSSETLESSNSKLMGLERAKDTHQQKLNDMQAAYQQLQMDKQAVSVRQSTICEQLQEAELTLEAIIESLPEEASLREWEERSEKLASRITRLGPINLAAIEEHDTLLERKEYIDKQHADLEEALTILQNAIHKIDKETRSKFKETFDKVNNGFKDLFPKVFGGGNASLELSDEDFLSAGVIVKAQPPGKRNSTIHMLSGGEKALTAIALVFGLFQLNPAPFCILDEVDAPLDDLNVGRYCRLIGEMAKSIQFIVISHNKVTIESCDRLLGITMQEPGVSRVVSVDIEEAVSLAEA